MQYAAEADLQIAILLDYYELKGRFQAIAASGNAADIAERMIAAKPHQGLPAPRPIPGRLPEFAPMPS